MMLSRQLLASKLRMKLLTLAVVLLLASGAMDARQASAKSAAQGSTLPGQLDNEGFLIRTLQLALPTPGTPIRIYFHGACQTEQSIGGIGLPPLNIQAPRSGQTGLSAVRAIFRNQKDVMVTQDRSGVIRIVIGDVFRSFLNAPLTSVHLKEMAQYNPDGPGGAIASIENDSAVQRSMHEFGVRQQLVFYIGLVRPSLPSLPHLPASIKRMNVDQSLDLIARTFPGAVVYGECKAADAHLVDIRFDWFRDR